MSFFAALLKPIIGALSAIAVSVLSVFSNVASNIPTLATNPSPNPPATTSPSATNGASIKQVTIPGADGGKIPAVLIAPKGGTGPYPLIVMPSSWSSNELEYTLSGLKLAANSGYIVISYTSRGFYNSTGMIDVAAPLTVKDASAVIDWALKNTPSDPNRIGMLGVSYGAGTSLLAAAADPRIKAISAMDAWTDLKNSFDYQDTISSAALNSLTQAGYFTGTLGPDLVSYNEQVKQVTSGWSTPLAFEKQIQDFTYSRSAINFVDKINQNRTAVMIANTWRDSFFPPSQFTPFMEKLTTPKMLIMSKGDHAAAGATGMLGLPNNVWDKATLWFDHYLKGIDNGVEKQSALQFQNINTNEWSGFNSFNDYATPTIYNLTGAAGFLLPTGSLAKAPAAWEQTIIAGIPTVANSGINFISGYLNAFLNVPILTDIPLVVRKNGSVWNSPAYSSSKVVQGAPKVHVTLKSSSQKMSVYAYLYDVNAFGAATLITHGPYTKWDAVPGQTFDADIAMQPALYTVPAGHHLTLVMDTIDYRYYSAESIGSNLSFSSTIANPATLSVSLK